MYIVNKNFDSEKRSSNFIDCGIHENVELVGVEYNISPNGNEFIVFRFEKDGKKLDHTEYKPKDVDPDILQNKTVNQIKRVKHIVTKFISNEAYDVTANDFKEFCMKTIALLGTSYKGKLVRIKVVYSNNNFTSLPKYVPFIESMDVPLEKTTLEILSIDKMVKDRPDTEQPGQTNPFATPTTNVAAPSEQRDVTTSQPENDLPF